MKRMEGVGDLSLKCYIEQCEEPVSQFVMRCIHIIVVTETAVR